MTSRRAKRRRIPVQRYGFDVDDDTSEDEPEAGEERQVTANDTIFSNSAESSTSDSEGERDEIMDSLAPSESPDYPNYDRNSGWLRVVAGEDIPRNFPSFDGIPGLQHPIPDAPELLALLILDEEYFTRLAEYTNSRAHQREYSRVNRLGRRKHTVQWTDVNSSDIKKLFAYILLTGIVQKPRLRDYFSGNTYIDTPFFRRSDTLSRDKFLLLLSNLRFASYDNGDSRPQKMDKVQPIIELLRQKVQSTYKIEGKGSIDEFLLLFKGRLHMKQYIPKKRSRFGIKGFSLNEDRTGYTYDFEIYSGQEGSQDWCAGIDGADELSVSERIVVHLLHRSGLLGKNFTLAIDNWFCSYRLISYLLSKDTMCMGTVKCNRGVPNDLSKFKLHPVSSEFARNGDVLVVKFCDKRDVYLMSSANIAETETKQRIKKDGIQIEYERPIMIKDYNLLMNGTDRIDQTLATVKCHRKSYIWPKKLGLHLAQRVGVVNGFVLAKKYFPLEMRYKSFADYELLLIEALLKLANTPDPRQSNMPIQHELEKIPATERRPRPSLPCVWCRRNMPTGSGNRPRESRYRCKVCLNKPPLHMQDCFRLYHE